METGIQVSSLKPLLTTPEEVRTACEKMAVLGSGPVQLQWIDPAVSIEAIAGALAENHLQSVSVQDFYDTVAGNFEYYVNLNAATGGTWLCVSRIPDACKSADGLDEYVRQLRAMQDKLTPLGQKLCFHPVTGDYRAIPGMDAVALLLEKMPELMLCLDLFHLNRNCADMPGFIRRYGSRICMVHFKDSIGTALVPAGQGEVNWEGVVRACLEAGVPYGFVEQETWNRDPYDCLREALQWLYDQL